NELKFIIVFFLLLTPPVAWQIIGGFQRSHGMRRAALVFGIGVLFAVPLVLTVRGISLEKPVEPTEARRAGVSKAERDLFAWIRDHTPAGAVFMEGNDYNWMPVFGDRRSFIGTRQTIEIFGYGNEEVAQCGRVRSAIFSEAPITKEDIDFLRGMKLSIYIVAWREDSERLPGLEGRLADRPEWFERVYGGAAGTIYRLVP
ncbi:MAG: hypothetical protein PHD74_04565, partial [Candidatus Krumholzibacteria bacterium]|nr:hypothetical protein [Candidatus Krumholzibacteria bacterium]